MSDVKSWDEYYYNICNVVATNSKCLSRHIGAILVRDKSIISTGYNSPPRGIPNCSDRSMVDKILSELIHKTKSTVEEYRQLKQCPRKFLGYKSGEGLDLCVAGHAERNVLINAARHGISTMDGILYMNCGIPCTPCLIEIINAGISEIVVTKEMYYDKSAEYILKNSSLKYRLFKCITNDSINSY